MVPLARSLQSSPKDLIEQRTSSDDRKTLDTSCFCAGLFERFVLYIFRVLETINFTDMWEVFIPAVFESLYRKVTPCSLYGCLMRKDWPCSFCWCQRLSKTFLSSFLVLIKLKGGMFDLWRSLLSFPIPRVRGSLSLFYYLVSSFVSFLSTLSLLKILKYLFFAPKIWERKFQFFIYL